MSYSGLGKCYNNFLLILLYVTSISKILIIVCYDGHSDENKRFIAIKVISFSHCSYMAYYYKKDTYIAAYSVMVNLVDSKWLGVQIPDSIIEEVVDTPLW